MRIAMIGARGVVVGERGGGIERHVAELSTRIAQEADVTVFCRRDRKEEQPTSFGRVHLQYVRTVHGKYLENLIATIGALAHAIRGKYDIIHLHGIGPGGLSWLPRLLTKATVIVTLHGQDQYHGKWGPFVRAALMLAERISVRSPHYTISVSHVMQVFCRARFGVETVYIPNGVEVRQVPALDVLKSFNLLPQGYMLTVGRLVPQKGIHELIAAYRQLATRMPLVVVGSSSYTDRYIAKLRALAGNDARIRFVGFQSGDMLAALYGYAYLFVHPSHVEGLSIAVLEAMRYGVAPLVADIPANLEAINGNGFTFRVGDVDGMRERLAALIADRRGVAMMGERAKADVSERCTWERAAEATLNVYRSARH